MNETIQISLNKSESLVLFELLSRFGSDDKLTIEDRAEAAVLENLLRGLEKSLVEPFKENYAELLSTARRNVRDNR